MGDGQNEKLVTGVPWGFEPLVGTVDRWPVTDGARRFSGVHDIVCLGCKVCTYIFWVFAQRMYATSHALHLVVARYISLSLSFS